MEIPHEVTPRKDTGLFNSKLGIWLFLASEVMLFGGLFSALVFLRVGIIEGVDPPWPWGLHVHRTFVFIGFVNTIVLIVSSVFVVFGWVALKERNFRRFQLYMFATVACAALFMGFKTVEYRSKLVEHHDVRLKDNSLIEGKILDGTYNIPFQANSGLFNLATSLPDFLGDFKGEFPVFTIKWNEAENSGTREVKLTEKTVEIASAADLRSWFVKTRSSIGRNFSKERSRYRKELASKERAARSGGEIVEPMAPVTDSKASFTTAAPFDITARFRRVQPVSRGETEDTLIYNDGSSLRGKAGDDSIKFEPHVVDLQLVPLHKQKEAMVWDVINDPAGKEFWFQERDKAYSEMEEYYSARNQAIPQSLLRGYYINLHSLHSTAHDKPFFQRFIKEFKKAAGFGDVGSSGSNQDKSDQIAHGGGKGKAPDSSIDATPEGHSSDGHSAYAVVTIPRDQLTFFSNHGPRNNNYFAIYFTITALHGLHVVGGALVLLYFALFGKSIYRKNPEHLANRVEVGGLFWHFVDLVWIFLFPIMYLL